MTILPKKRTRPTDFSGTFNGYKDLTLQMARNRAEPEAGRNTPHTRPRVLEGSLERIMPKKETLPATVFDTLAETRDFGTMWLNKSLQHMVAVRDMLKELLSQHAGIDATITVPLICDAACMPIDNGGGCSVADLKCSLTDAAGWAKMLRRLRYDVAYRELVARIASKSFGVDLRVGLVTLQPYETYYWTAPFDYTVVPMTAYEINIMTLAPLLPALK